MSRSLIISHAAPGKGREGAGEAEVECESWFIFGGQNEYFLYFLRNTGHKIDVTFVLALEKYGRNMAALGSSCQAEFAHPFPLPHLSCFPSCQLQCALFVPRNWQWKILAPAETTFQFESAGHLYRSPSLSLPSLSSCLSSLALSTAASRWQWVREIYRPQHILGFGLTSPRLASPLPGHRPWLPGHARHSGTPSIIAAPALRVVDALHKLFLHERLPPPPPPFRLLRQTFLRSVNDIEDSAKKKKKKTQNGKEKVQSQSRRQLQSAFR